ncbi:hypothetical protein ACFO5R_00410 [Halosolutus amylolyticus]|uniref:Uncharacterized protein n=1 Tax=Halosolutus amylolyticus TaxID=2932267 RepID=A0ABD5PJ80_9EURY|nr:hypothetical protein [Halosolutus amylolyticus]
MNNDKTKPPVSELPDYILGPLKSQSPERLEVISEYADTLAAWKREKHNHEHHQKQAKEEVDADQPENLEDREISTDPRDYEEVPVSGAYITIKETKPGYYYYYWQRREGNSWKNKYIAPVSPKED